MLGATPAGILEEAGWARSVAGAGPYLTLFTRGGVGREQADNAVANLEIHELPSARGCTYVVPASDFPLALKLSQSFGDADMRIASKLGVTQAEVDKLCDAVLQALSKGPLDPEEVRQATGGASRSLGEEGKKKGLTTTLTLGLGRLQRLGEIRRVPTNGRLDQQRYRYTLWRPNPLADFAWTTDECYTELARRYFAWIGPATLDEFRGFAGLGVKAAKAAVEPLKLERPRPEDERLMMPGDRERLAEFRVPAEPHFALTSGLDGMLQLGGDLRALLSGDDCSQCVPVENGMREIGSLRDLTDHAILDRGRVVGAWAYDTGTESIVWRSFIPTQKALVSAVERTEAYIRSELGDARSFSLDSPKSRASRIAAFRDAH